MLSCTRATLTFLLCSRERSGNKKQNFFLCENFKQCNERADILLCHSSSTTNCSGRSRECLNKEGAWFWWLTSFLKYVHSLPPSLYSCCGCSLAKTPKPPKQEKLSSKKVEVEKVGINIRLDPRGQILLCRMPAVNPLLLSNGCRLA